MSIDIYIFILNVTSMLGYTMVQFFLNNPNTILICNIKNISIEHKDSKVLHISPSVEDGSLIHCIHFKPTKRDPHKSIKGLKV